MHHHIKGHALLNSVHQFGSIRYRLDLFMPMLSDINIKNQETMKLASFTDNIHLTCISKLTSWILCIIGLLHKNIQYGMPQLQHYNFGQQTLSHMSSAMPHNEYTQLSPTATPHSNCKTCQMKYSLVTS